MSPVIPWSARYGKAAPWTYFFSHGNYFWQKFFVIWYGSILHIVFWMISSPCLAQEQLSLFLVAHFFLEIYYGHKKVFSWILCDKSFYEKHYTKFYNHIPGHAKVSDSIERWCTEPVFSLFKDMHRYNIISSIFNSVE